MWNKGGEGGVGVSRLGGGGHGDKWILRCWVEGGQDERRVRLEVKSWWQGCAVCNDVILGSLRGAPQKQGTLDDPRFISTVMCTAVRGLRGSHSVVIRC
jgi:hypothetical protein